MRLYAKWKIKYEKSHTKLERKEPGYDNSRTFNAYTKDEFLYTAKQ